MKMSSEDFTEGQVILIDKPLGWSSFQVVNKIRGAIMKGFGIKNIKVGHAGTLDPLASGLLVICTGKKTKIISEIQNADKEYTGEITLGGTTPSYDMETEVNEKFATMHINDDMIEASRQRFLGESMQYPPVFSAIKKEGKRLYELAREGKEVELEPRKIRINYLSFDTDGLKNSKKIQFVIGCSKGTYIRSFANDFGADLISGGYLSKLRRTKIGELDVKDAVSPEEYIKKYIDGEED